MIRILGISAYYHDSAAAIIADGKIIAAAQEERFTRIKHTPDFPINAIRYCLEEAGCTINDLDAIVFYDKPFLKFERLLETYYAFAPKGLLSFLKAIPIWLKEKLFLKTKILKELKQIENYDKQKIKLLFSEHHLSHAASTFYCSNFENSAILTIDGVGEWCTASIGKGKKNHLEILKEMEFPHSVGLLYSAFTYYLGFTVNSGEYKLMGLAPYGNLYDQETSKFIETIKNQLISIKSDGSVWLNQQYFSYTTDLKMVNESEWKKLFGIPKRSQESEILQTHCNLALAIQTVTEEIVIAMAKEAKQITQSDYLCMAGGVALNCTANGKLLNENIFKEIYIQPASGDAGGALGAALAAYYLYFMQERKIDDQKDVMQGAYLGPEYCDKEIMAMNKRNNAVYTFYQDDNVLNQSIAAKLTEGKIVGWFQGKMEFGPRALGNRSILADPRNEEMQKKLNLKIKFRESFRPFAPSVLQEKQAEYFEMQNASLYMLFVSKIKKELCISSKQNVNGNSILEKLYSKTSQFQAITHVDYSARIQTVTNKSNEKFWKLISAFDQITGVGMLINTSFNVRGEPIVCSPFDAYRCFMSTEMDFLVIGNFVYDKKLQPENENKEKWKINFSPD